MKKEFIGFYEPTKGEIAKSWKEGAFSFDANSLLNLYRYTAKTSQDFINVIKKVKGRIWIPYQSGFEFHNNRQTVIDTQANAYGEIHLILDKQMNQLEKELGSFKKHCLIETKSYIEEIASFFNHIKETLEKIKLKHPDYSKGDNVLEQVTKLLTDKIGKELSLDELTEIYKEGQKRYENKVPPGYCDSNDSKKKAGGNKHIFGDLIIWKELMKEFSKNPRPLIFVTDDRKEDWWSKHNGKTIRPREELIKEFFEKTGIRILIYQADVFLEYAKKQIDSDIDAKSIKEIKDTRISDEQFLRTLQVPLSYQFDPTTLRSGTTVPPNLFPSSSELFLAKMPSSSDYLKAFDNLTVKYPSSSPYLTLDPSAALYNPLLYNPLKYPGSDDYTTNIPNPLTPPVKKKSSEDSDSK